MRQEELEIANLASHISPAQKQPMQHEEFDRPPSTLDAHIEPSTAKQLNKKNDNEVEMVNDFMAQ